KPRSLELKNPSIVPGDAAAPARFRGAYLEAPAAADAQVHLEHVESGTTPPNRFGIADRLEDELRRRGNVDLAGDRVLIGCDRDVSGHDVLGQDACRHRVLQFADEVTHL